MKNEEMALLFSEATLISSQISRQKNPGDHYGGNAM